MALFKFVILINLIILINCKVPKLILISFDSFRADYLDPELSPTIFKLAKDGVSTDKMISTFPTKTFTNHHSINTGLYAENHGIINNAIYDPEFDDFFEMPNLEERWWNYNDVSTIWNLNEEFGKGRKSAVSMWPGSAVEYKKKKPKYIIKYENNIPMNVRIDKVIEWLTLKKEPANFVALYLFELDNVVHNFGPFSPEAKQAIKELDDSIAYLLKKLEETKLLAETNLIILSDHGSSEIREERVMNLTLVCDSKDLIISGDSPIKDLFIKDKSKLDQIYDQLLKASQKLPFNVFKRESVPIRFHLNNNRRIGDLVILANIGYDVILDKSLTSFNQKVANNKINEMIFMIEKYRNLDQVNKQHNITEKFEDFIKRKESSKLKFWGNHGYDNYDDNMRPLFLAKGPAFKTNYTHNTPFINIDVYPLICSVLQLNSNDSMKGKKESYCKNDAKPWRIEEMLSPVKGGRNFDKPPFSKWYIAIGLVATAIILSTCTFFVYTRNRKTKERGIHYMNQENELH